MLIQLNRLVQLPAKIARRLSRMGTLCALALLVVSSLTVQVSGDEIIIDESLTKTQTVGDFHVSNCDKPIVIDESSLFDEHGEISAGKLYSFFKSQGIDSIDQINFVIDLDPNSKRTDYQLNSLQLEIEDLTSDSGGRLFSLGSENSLTVPGYEASTMRPEAQIAVQLDYDFIKQFNENSTEKIKFQYTVDGEKMAVPVKIGVLSQGGGYSPTRMFFLLAFAGFWAVVFMVLFRVTTPKPHNAASPA